MGTESSLSRERLWGAPTPTSPTRNYTGGRVEEERGRRETRRRGEGEEEGEGDGEEVGRGGGGACNLFISYILWNTSLLLSA